MPKYCIFFLRFLLLIGLCLASTAGVCFSQAPEAPPDIAGSVDWVDETVAAGGVGFAPKGVESAAAEALARRAAVMDARRNLLETLKSVRIDSTTTVENFMTADDQVRARVDGLLGGSQVVDEERMPDGSVLVRVSAPLSRKVGAEQVFIEPAGTDAASLSARINRLESRLSRIERRLEALDRRVRDNARSVSVEERQATAAELRQIAAETTAAGRAVVGSTASAPTGLVIDARHTDFTPSLAPKIVGNESILYGAEAVVDANDLRPLVRYFRSIDAALTAPEAGASPLALTARSAVLSDIELTDADAELLSSMGDDIRPLLENRRVFVVY